MNTTIWTIISAGVAIAISLVIIAMALAIIKALFDGTISLKYLLAEPASPAPQQNAEAAGIPVAPEDAGAAPAANAAAPARPVRQPPEVPKASASRFQLVIFTFVIGGVYLVLCLESGTLIDIPQNVLWLLGVSGGTYTISKGIKTAGDASTSSSQA